MHTILVVTMHSEKVGARSCSSLGVLRFIMYALMLHLASFLASRAGVQRTLLTAAAAF